MKERIKVGIIGFGRMGGFYLTEMLKNPKWEVAYICDVDPEARAYARKFSPLSKVVEDEDVVLQIRMCKSWACLPWPIIVWSRFRKLFVPGNTLFRRNL